MGEDEEDGQPSSQQDLPSTQDLLEMEVPETPLKKIKKAGSPPTPQSHQSETQSTLLKEALKTSPVPARKKTMKSLMTKPAGKPTANLKRPASKKDAAKKQKHDEKETFKTGSLQIMVYRKMQ